MVQGVSTFVYRITSDDTIDFVNEAWRQFAVDNAAPELSDGVLGKSLWDYISGHETTHLSRELLASVRETGREKSVAFRCDSPRVRRYMRMRLVPLPRRQVEYRTWIERQEPFATPARILDSAEARSPGQLVRMCAWCKKVDVHGQWLEIDTAIDRLGMFTAQSVPQVTHTICAPCFERMVEHMRDREDS